MNLKLGKLPATRDKRDLLFSNYRTGLLPARPPRFGHTNLVNQPWEMLGNDRVGDCVFAGAAHMTMLWNAMAGRKAQFSEEAVLSDYSAVTGYDATDPSTDRGTNMRDMLNYWRNTGIADDNGARHKIAAFVSIEPGNYEHVMEAIYLFGAAKIGFMVMQETMNQFQDNDLWDLIWHDSPVIGGHDVPLVSRYNFINCVTWGRLQGMTQRFFTRQCDECYAVLSPEMMNEGKSLEGFNLEALMSDLGNL